MMRHFGRGPRHASLLLAKDDEGPQPTDQVFHENRNLRIMYRVDTDAVVIAEAYAKTTRTIPKSVIRVCKQRFKLYDDAAKSAQRKNRKAEGK